MQESECDVAGNLSTKLCCDTCVVEKLSLHKWHLDMAQSFACLGHGCCSPPEAGPSPATCKHQ